VAVGRLDAFFVSFGVRQVFLVPGAVSARTATRTGVACAPTRRQARGEHRRGRAFRFNVIDTPAEFEIPASDLEEDLLAVTRTGFRRTSTRTRSQSQRRVHRRQPRRERDLIIAVSAAPTCPGASPEHRIDHPRDHGGSANATIGFMPYMTNGFVTASGHSRRRST
jgi:hypothetical protein